MIKKKYRIKKIKEFNFMFRKGSKLSCNPITIVFLKGYLPYSKCGITIATKTGNAVIRNTIKRRIRVIWTSANKEGLILPRTNYIIVANQESKNLNFAELKNACYKIFNKIREKLC